MSRTQEKIALWSGLSFLFLGFLGLALFWYGTQIETRRFRLEKLKVKCGAASDSDAVTLMESDSACRTRQLRILHLSDLHLQPNDHKKLEFIRNITDEDFDMVVLTGDIFQFSNAYELGPFLLSRQPRLGAYAVFGNHDYYDYSIVNKTIGRIFRHMRQPEARKDITPHRRALEAGGFTVLINECCTADSGNIFIVGLDYPGISDEKLAQLMEQSPAGAGVLKLALFHLPWRLNQMAAAGFDLVFGGHTHGGQVRMPGFGALITDSELARSEASGLLRRGKTQFHISRGLGADPRSNLRLFCPPAATVIELTYSLKSSLQLCQ